MKQSRSVRKNGLRGWIVTLLVIQAVGQTGGVSLALALAQEDASEPEIHCVTTQLRTEEWVNRDCEVTKSCDLKNFQFNLRKTECDFGYGPEPLTVMVAGFETTSISQLDQYAIVQFIRGCVYNVDQNAQGVLSEGWGISRDFFGGTVKFQHPDWVIDTNDRDPVYWSSPRSGRSRIGEYSSIQRDDPFAFGHWVRYAKQPPATPALFVRDAPSSGALFVSGEGSERVVNATQSSLEFKTCIYRSSDVPRSVSQPTDVSFAQPLHCFEWNMSDIYDFELKRFTHPEGISAKCFEK